MSTSGDLFLVWRPKTKWYQPSPSHSIYNSIFVICITPTMWCTLQGLTSVCRNSQLRKLFDAWWTYSIDLPRQRFKKYGEQKASVWVSQVWRKPTTEGVLPQRTIRLTGDKAASSYDWCFAQKQLHQRMKWHSNKSSRFINMQSG